jgi:uncharacterized membrane protein YuzA (DUF378 family)
MKALDTIAMILLLIGGLNWGCVGVADFNFIMWTFIAMSTLQHAIYTSIGIAAIWTVVRRVCR